MGEGDGRRGWWLETGEAHLGLGPAYGAESPLELRAPHVDGSRDAFYSAWHEPLSGWANWTYHSRNSLHTFKPRAILGVQPKPRWVIPDEKIHLSQLRSPNRTKKLP